MFFVLVACTCCSAQKQNNNWCFGFNGWIDFNTTPPTTGISNIGSFEDCAIISDRNTGKILFYTDGTKVWNRQHLVMPNGNNIGTDLTYDCVQGSVIIPFPTDSNKFYVFTLDNFNSTGCLRYSVVDMKMDGGYGDVVTWQKAIVIDSNFTESMTSVNVCSTVWLALIKRTTNDFYFYSIGPNGISTTPVISHKGYARSSGGLTAIKISRNNQKLALTSWNAPDNISYLAIHDLDLRTGKVSGGMIIDSAINKNEFYTCEFSPDCSKLFATLYSSRLICQYDLTIPTVAAINSSRKTLYTSPVTIGGMQIGPDQNIYVSDPFTINVDQIIYPNLMSPGCIYKHNAITLSPTTRAQLTFPRPVDYLDYSPIISNRKTDTVVCNTPSVTLRAPKGHETYIWHDAGTADTNVVTASGKYWVKITDSCFEHTDTFLLTIIPHQNIDIGNDTDICDGVNTVFKNHYTNLPGSTYAWSTGSTDSTAVINKTGKYWLTISLGFCPVSDTVIIVSKPFPIVDIGNDTTICENTNIVLQSNPQNAGATYLWNTGSTSAQTLTKGKGVYTLTVNDKGCETTKSVNIYDMPLPKINIGNDTDICYPNYLTMPVDFIKGNNYSFLWSTGATDSTLTVQERGKYKVTLTNVCGVAVDSLVLDYHTCSIWFPQAFTPNGDGRNDILRLVGDVKGVSKFSVMIYNRWGQRVYESNNPFDGWDGSFKGQGAESGTYYYMMRLIYNRKEEVWKGDITLIR